jgi:hypothetical protein
VSGQQEATKDGSEHGSPSNLAREGDVVGAETQEKKIRKLWKALEEVVMNKVARRAGDLDVTERDELEMKIRKIKRAKSGEDLLDGCGNLVREWDAFNESILGTPLGSVVWKNYRRNANRKTT